MAAIMEIDFISFDKATEKVTQMFITGMITAEDLHRRINRLQEINSSTRNLAYDFSNDILYELEPKP